MQTLQIPSGCLAGPHIIIHQSPKKAPEALELRRFFGLQIGDGIHGARARGAEATGSQSGPAGKKAVTKAPKRPVVAGAAGPRAEADSKKSASYRKCWQRREDGELHVLTSATFSLLLARGRDEFSFPVLCCAFCQCFLCRFPLTLGIMARSL